MNDQIPKLRPSALRHCSKTNLWDGRKYNEEILWRKSGLAPKTNPLDGRKYNKEILWRKSNQALLQNKSFRLKEI